MPAVETRDRELIATLLRRDAAARAYEIGDLDEVEWPHTRWFGWDADGRLEEVVLLYTRPAVPVLLAIAPRGPSTSLRLLDELVDALPSPLYVHVSPPLLDALRTRYDVEHAADHLKLALTSTERVETEAARVDAEVLGPATVDDVVAFYAEAYPGTWFEPHQLETGRYVGIRRGGRLVCVAGVHVHSPAWGVAALGNVATIPSERGQGLARGACAALCLLLLEDGIETIALNVRADNVPAQRAYERIGFTRVAEYVEASLVAQRGGP